MKTFLAMMIIVSYSITDPAEALEHKTKLILIFIYQLFSQCDFTLAGCGDFTHTVNDLTCNVQLHTVCDSQCFILLN